MATTKATIQPMITVLRCPVHHVAKRLIERRTVANSSVGLHRLPIRPRQLHFDRCPIPDRALPARRQLCLRQSGGTSPGGQRPQRLPCRRRRYGRQHGDDDARRDGGARPPRRARGRRGRSHPAGPGTGPGGADGRPRQLRRDPQPDRPRRRRGAGQPARRADRPGPGRLRLRQRRRRRLRLGARAGRGDDADRLSRDGALDRPPARPPRRRETAARAGRPGRDAGRGSRRGPGAGDRRRAARGRTHARAA